MTDYIVPSLIVKNPVIEKNLYEDGDAFTIPDLINEYWIGVEFNKEGTVACFRANRIGAVHWQGHAYVLPDYRENSVIFNQAALIWCFDNIQDIQIVTVSIPSYLGNVVKHVQDVGFKHVGTLEKSYSCKGKLVNQEILSISREVVESF